MLVPVRLLMRLQMALACQADRARIAILADIHGNRAAFEAALKHVANLKVDQIIIAGDIIHRVQCASRSHSIARHRDSLAFKKVG
jgi:Icc-related predicted phosphoesterase